MAALERLRLHWSGFAGAPGITTLYFHDASLHLAALGTWLGGYVNALPAGVQIAPESGGDVIESTTGVITGSWAAAAQPSVGFGGGGVYAAPAGFEVRWETATFLSGRRLRGRTYFVPASAQMFQDDGTLAGGLLIGRQTEAQAFVDASPGNLLIWQRPREATPSWTDVHGTNHAAKAARVGGFGTVVTATIPDKVVVLRSRRD